MKLNKLKDWLLDQIGREISIDQFAPSSILTGYKGHTTFDTAAFYCPYIPLQTINIHKTAVVDQITGETFTLKDILEKHARDNQ